MKITTYSILILLLGWFLGTQFNCHHCPPPCEAKKDSVSLKEETQKYAPEIAVIEPGRIPEPQSIRVDSFIAFEPVDTAAIIRQYYQRVFYDDSIHTQYGVINVKDSVTENRIVARQVFTDFRFPVYTKKRNQLFFGMNGQYMKYNNVLSIGPSLTLKTKRDRMYRATALLGSDGYWSYQGAIDIPIRLKN